MKYFKKFEEESEYIAYRNSENFITPNVTLIASNKKVFMTNRFEDFEVSDGVFEVTDGIFKVLK